MSAVASTPTLKAKVGKLPSMRWNVLVIGEQSCGKKTFLRSLFKPYVAAVAFTNSVAPVEKNTQGKVEIKETMHFVLPSVQVDCRVQISEAVGIGEYIDNRESIQVIKKSLLERHERWLALDANSMREEDRNDLDDRIHCIFYFLPFGRMNQADELFLSEISGLSVIVPVISKADALTPLERQNFLVKVQDDGC
jgi:septin family protein